MRKSIGPIWSQPGQAGAGRPPPVGQHPSPSKGRDGRSAPGSSAPDEFPVGYSLAGCSPAKPAFVHQPIPGALEVEAGNDPSANGRLSLIPCLRHGVHSSLGEKGTACGGKGWGKRGQPELRDFASPRTGRNHAVQAVPFSAPLFCPPFSAPFLPFLLLFRFPFLLP